MKRKENKFSIGRGCECDIVFADDSVSRLHAELTFLKNGKLLLTDCKSHNGTYLIFNGKEKPIHQELVSPLDTIQFGDVKIKMKELLESLQLKFPSFDTGRIVPQDESHPQPKKIWVQGKRLVRCECGAIKAKEETCPECGK